MSRDQRGPSASRLFSPVVIGGVEIPNRIVMPPMTTRLADDRGFVTDETIAYYEARARGGVGLITVEMASPEPAGRHRFRELGISEDVFLPGLRRLVSALHDAGSRVSIQLGHGGSRARGAVFGETPIAPSAVTTPVFEIEPETITPQAMTQNRIDQTKAAFVSAARRAQKAGFDLVEVHAAHGYLISQFLSPMENVRQDAYGGSLENRARFGLEILRAIKREVPGLPVIFRLGIEDFFNGGLTLDEGLQIASWVADAGADALGVTAGHYRSLPSAERMIPPMAYPQGTFLDFARRAKRQVTIPVIGVGRLGDPAKAMAAVDEGDVDLVALGRTLLADPEWPAKARSGAAIRRCLSCNHCVNNMRSGAGISCVVNAAAGNELLFTHASPPRGERICVIGAGPAGLSYTSLVAGSNKVTLFERADRAGGAFRLTGKAPRFNDVVASEDSFATYIAELERSCLEQDVEFRFGTDVTRNPELLRGFDRIVIAAGARYRWGLGPLVLWILDRGLGKSRLSERLFANAKVREFLYYVLRRGCGDEIKKCVPATAAVQVIGDAASAGKAREAVADAFRAALLTMQPERRHHEQPQGCTTSMPFAR